MDFNNTDNKVLYSLRYHNYFSVWSCKNNKRQHLDKTIIELTNHVFLSNEKSMYITFKLKYALKIHQ